MEEGMKGGERDQKECRRGKSGASNQKQTTTTTKRSKGKIEIDKKTESRGARAFLASGIM